MPGEPTSQLATKWWKTIRNPLRAYIASKLEVRLNNPDVDDIEQDVALRAVRAGEPGTRITEFSSFVAWVHTVARNLIIDVQRRRGKRGNPLPMTGAQLDELSRSRSERESPDAETLELLQKTVESLPEEIRRIVCWHFYDGESFVQIAERLGEKPGAVKMRLYRAIDKLRPNLKDLDG